MFVVIATSNALLGHDSVIARVLYISKVRRKLERAYLVLLHHASSRSSLPGFTVREDTGHWDPSVIATGIG
ncbi:hypothetical protein RRG08_025589 [Elysia crispata]|uniref:Uncharacterized protein n=1 Tax=Elysia crispata TaxID=231223 RepID=A0AAE1CXS4_9GAST|nr:hypothetical protein RRG08_025589 [Elysia crispata]